MESKPKIPIRVYEEFEPSTTWERNPNFDTLIVHLPDFEKEQLKVQVTSTNTLRITGECPLGKDKWSRFRKEFPIASNHEANQISAKFERGALRIKHTNIVATVDHQTELKAEEEPTEALKTQKSKTDSSQAAAQEVNPPSAGNNSSQLKNGQKEESKKPDPSKTTSLEKQTRVGSASADVANTASRKSSEKKSTEDHFADHEDTTAEKGEKEAAGNSNGNAEKFRVEKMKQALGGLVMEMKQPKKIMIMIVAVLVVLVAWIYARNAI